MEKLCIGIATMGTVKTKTMFSLHKLIKKFPNISMQTWEGCIVHQSRINIVKEVLKSGCTHLLFVDHDMVFEPEAVEKLLEANKDIVAAPCNLRKLPLTANVRLLDVKKDELFECEAIGTAFMIIKTFVFKTIPRPWFFYEQDENGDMRVSEDVWFCKKAIEAGYKIWCEPRAVVGHIGDYIF